MDSFIVENTTNVNSSNKNTTNVTQNNSKNTAVDGTTDTNAVSYEANDTNPVSDKANDTNAVSNDNSTPHKDEVKQSSTAPDFTVYDLEQNPINLSDFFGKPIIINFWASWCGPCKMEMPDFNEAFCTVSLEPSVILTIKN